MNRLLFWLSRRWLLLILVPLGIFNGLPWLAPLFMNLGWTKAADFVYLLYSTQCHQLPQRSFFLYGPARMISLDTIQSVWQASNNPLLLRQFIGNPAMGWKVAWSDRMVYMYTSTFVLGSLFWPLRKRIKSVPWWGLLLMLAPMMVDGLSHMVSDFTAGIGLGFRDTNAWLAAVTNHSLPVTFYAGDALGSFNAWMRLITGIFFGLGVVWFAFPLLEEQFTAVSQQIALKFERKGLEL